MERYICIHGHFYQPPRENAWLEYVEKQDSAYPYHDWNERVTAECYAPNSASRILDGEDYITQITNNYASISFNFGPTLLSWLEEHADDIYQAVLAADRLSMEKFSGHGSALAQAYSHLIMPLANRRDKWTQVLWGIRDFEKRFGRKPEGMWLPETAVDLESLDIMAEQGIRFTVLAPHQVNKVRPLGSQEWQKVENSDIDPTMAYVQPLASGRKIAVLFYDGPISRNVAFEDVLKSGEAFAHHLTAAFSGERDCPQLVHIATDGETYGHHHRFADMALAYALRYIESENLARITNYGEFLAQHPPTHEVGIVENTSWSCCHGIERWRSDCGCNAGRNPKWNQAWRAPLRESMDWLRDTMAPRYEEAAQALLKDPWTARDAYISVIMDRSPENVQKFLEQHGAHPLDEAEKIRALKLLELQRHAMLMYTSCGWFFDELSGIETVQVIQYAGRALQLAGEVLGDNIEEQFLGRLEKAKSNLPEHGDGRRIYEKWIKPAMVDLTSVAAHFAINSLFIEYADNTRVYCYDIDLEDYQSMVAGKPKLALGRARVTSEITLENDTISFGVLHFGDHNVNAGVRSFQGEEAYQQMVNEVSQTFSRADFPGVIRLLDRHFGTSTYSLRNLFHDDQRRVLDNILQSALKDIEAAYQQVYERNYPPMRFLIETGTPVPRAFCTAAGFILNSGLRDELSREELDMDRIKSLLEEVKTWEVELDTEGLEYLFRQNLERMAGELAAAPAEVDHLEKLLAAVTLGSSLPFPLDLWKVQNLYHQTQLAAYPEWQQKAQQGDGTAASWVQHFIDLGKQLQIRVT
ncbi:MAG: DUF3536 domain-containing protein [Chloroflexota bacterium]